MLPQHVQDLIYQDMVATGSADNGATPFSFSMAPSAGIPAATQGTVFKDDESSYGRDVGEVRSTRRLQLKVSGARISTGQAHRVRILWRGGIQCSGCDDGAEA